VEDSNVQPVLELTKLIQQERDFQSAANFIEAEGQRRQTAINKLTDITAQT